MKIAIFYHCLFVSGNPPEPLEKAIRVVHEQMEMIRLCGLENAANEIHCGVNGSDESIALARALLPKKAQITYHGLHSRSENLTIAMMEEWISWNPNWAVLYFHAKGAFHGEDYTNNWRRCLMLHCIWNWRTCVGDLEHKQPFQSVGAHWLRNYGPDGSQNYWGGNFFWANSNFLMTLPSIHTKAACLMHGTASPQARFEAETWIGGGIRLPTVRDYATHEIMRCPDI